MNEISLYFHIPFCRRRCGYCDFNTFAGMNQYIPAYVKALCREVEVVLSKVPEEMRVHTIYFGGGTPSLLCPDDFDQILKTVKKLVAVNPNAEITLEANPETVSEKGLQKLSGIGFNRISFGMQSASVRDLKVLDRRHDYQSIVNAILWSHRAGINHINLDLIFGIPGQTLDSWHRTLETASQLGVDHLSVYSLILEDGTRLKKWVDRGLLQSPEDDLAADMYELTMDYLPTNGYAQYEISNWALTDSASSRHNLQYWRFQPYLGFGAGAHGFWNDLRIENVGQIPMYIDRMNNISSPAFPAGPASKETTHLTLWDQLQENMMVSLRLTLEGVSIEELSDRYQVNLLEVFKVQINRLVRQGLLEYFDGEKRLRLTRKGRLFGNRVFAEFIGNPTPRGFEQKNDQNT